MSKAKPAKAKTKTKPRASTASRRSSDLIEWVEKYGKRPQPNRTSEVIAELAGKALGFTVSANRIARELGRQNIAFRRTELDPPAPNFSKVELLRGQVAYLMERIAVLEKEVLGKVSENQYTQVPASAPAKPRAKAKAKPAAKPAAKKTPAKVKAKPVAKVKAKPAAKKRAPTVKKTQAPATPTEPVINSAVPVDTAPPVPVETPPVEPPAAA